MIPIIEYINLRISFYESYYYFNSNAMNLVPLSTLTKSNKAFLSFPIKGWTLAVDIPANNTKTYKALDYLDQLVAREGGRLYLAKDSRQSNKNFLKTYPKYYEWLEIKKEMDPRNIFASDLSDRSIFIN